MFFRKLKKTIIRLFLLFPMTMKLRVVLLRAAGYKIGVHCTIGQNFLVSDRRSDKNNIEIGNRVNIAANVTFITTSAPNTSRLNRVYREKSGRITILDDCWIGTGAIILPGVTIGKCSIVGAGVVVENDVPDFTAIKQNSCEMIKYPENLIKVLTNG